MTTTMHIIGVIAGVAFIGIAIAFNPEMPSLLAYMAGWGVGIWFCMELDRK